MQLTPWIITIAAIVPPVIEKLKNDPSIDFITPRTKDRLTAFAMILTALGSVAVGLEAGTVELGTWIGFAEAAVHFVVTFGLSEIIYQHVIKRFQKA